MTDRGRDKKFDASAECYFTPMQANGYYTRGDLHSFGGFACAEGEVVQRRFVERAVNEVDGKGEEGSKEYGIAGAQAEISCCLSLFFSARRNRVLEIALCECKEQERV